MKSIVSYKERGNFGNYKYRGNTTGKIIVDLLKHYKPKQFVEVFAGGGTGYDVARHMGYTKSIHLDLNDAFGNWNALRDEMPQGSDFVFSHPPYHDIIKYSGNMWGKPHPDDLSRCETYEEFIHKLNIVNAKIYNSLQKGGYHAFLVGDVRSKGKYYSIIKDMIWYGELDSHIIKVQHNMMSNSKSYAGKFIPIVHEHLLVFKKGEIWTIPLKVTRQEERSLKDSALATWRDLVQAAIEQLGGNATLQNIYKVLANTKKAKNNKNWEAKIRQTLQINPQFERVARGHWSLAVA